jgi:signal transduction histidine kinase/CheY-like chemotaxis protein
VSASECSRPGSGSPVVGYLTAFSLGAVAILLRLGLDHRAGPSAGVLLSVVVVALSASIGGRGPALAANGLSVVPDLVAWFRSGMTRPDAGASTQIALLLVTGVVLTAVICRWRDTERDLRRTVVSVQQALQERRAADSDTEHRVVHLERALAARDRFAQKREAAWRQDQRRRREAELLSQLMMQLHTLLDVDAMLHPLAAVVRELTDAEVIRIGLRDSGGQRFRTRYGLGAEELVSEAATIDFESEPVRFVLTTGRVFPGRESKTVSRPEALQVPADAEAIAIAPLQIGTSVEGLIIAARRSARPFDLRDQDTLGQIAQIAAIAVRNARLLAGEQSARAEAEASIRAKDEFLAMLGHELRNPLGAVSHAVAGLGRIAGDWSQFQQIMERQTRHLGHLLDDLLDISRLTTGKIGIQRRVVDLRRVVEDVVRGLEREGKAARHDIRFSGGPVSVFADPTRLEQIVQNLVDNALKYTPPGGRIALAIAVERGEAVLRVRDTGIGIRAEMLPRIFDLFVQQPQTLDRHEGGLGLGLTVVKRLVELHGGTVSAFSGGPGQGSEFVVRLPGETARPTMTTDPGAADAGGPRHRPCRVAVVEDYADARDALTRLLVLDGHHVETAADGPRGVEVLLTGQADVAFVDIGLPGFDGYEVARRTRSALGPTTPHLVALTGYGQPYDRARALEAGFDDHLVKPLDLDALMAVLSRIPVRDRTAHS